MSTQYNITTAIRHDINAKDRNLLDKTCFITSKNTCINIKFLIHD